MPLSWRWAPLALKLSVAVIALAVVSLWWQRRRLLGEARDRARPACVERLGDEATCQQHLDAYDDDCSRYGHAFVDGAGYLECIVLTPDGWYAERKARHDGAQQQRSKDAQIP
jgi:heme exporter protein D